MRQARAHTSAGIGELIALGQANFADDVLFTMSAVLPK